MLSLLSELDNPHHALMRLVQPSISHLPSDIIAVYLQATLKVFSYWAYELVGRWDDSQLPRVEMTVTAVLDAIASFASHADIEVQERVSNCHDVDIF
jgi:AP-3 complex subunit delta-1